MSLSNPTNATIGNNSATGVILDESDDPCQPRPQHRRRQTRGQHQRHRRPTIEGVDNTLVFTVSQSNLSTLDTVVDVTLGASSNISAADLASISYTNAAGNVVTLTTSAQIQAFLDNESSPRQDCSGSTVAPVITNTVADEPSTPSIRRPSTEYQ